jgi:enoyl-CoA hydratase/carnithine racemase
VPLSQLRDEARAFAVEIARSAPLAVLSIRETMRGDIAQRVKEATDHEISEQSRLQQTEDFAEGVRAMADRRLPDFHGR